MINGDQARSRDAPTRVSHVLSKLRCPAAARQRRRSAATVIVREARPHDGRTHCVRSSLQTMFASGARSLIVGALGERTVVESCPGGVGVRRDGR